MITILLLICTLIWRVNNYVCLQGNVKIGEMKVLLGLYINCRTQVLYWIYDCLYSDWNLFPRNKRRLWFVIKIKTQIQSWPLTEFSLSSMATHRNKRKLAAVSRETPESTRSGRAQNILDPELTQDYISQVSEEIEGRAPKKLSKEFSRTESRILGALSKLDELLLNPQVRTCSVAVPGTTRNNSSQNRETTGDRSSDDPCPEVRFSSHHFGHLNSPEVENYPHSNYSVLFRCATQMLGFCRVGKQGVSRFWYRLICCLSLLDFLWNSSRKIITWFSQRSDWVYSCSST